MVSQKRKSVPSGFERRVRPRKDEESDIGTESDEAPSSESIAGNSDLAEEDGSESQGDSSNDESDNGSENGDEVPQIDISSVSFGDLKKAHDALSSHKSSHAVATGKPPRSKDVTRSLNPTKDRKKILPTTKRSSKHAPTEISATRPVSRHRDFFHHQDDTPKAAAPRDPRFDPLCGSLDESRHRRAYAFLDSYRDKEMDSLRADIAKAKRKKNGIDPETVEEWKRKLMAIESKQKQEKRKDEARKVLDEHRKKEKELVKEGKNPYYLKKSELKKRVLAERFKGMSEGQVKKSIVRKRKKIAGKDKKEMARVEMVTANRRRAGA